MSNGQTVHVATRIRHSSVCSGPDDSERVVGKQEVIQKRASRKSELMRRPVALHFAQAYSWPGLFPSSPNLLLNSGKHRGSFRNSPRRFVPGFLTRCAHWTCDPPSKYSCSKAFL